MLGKVWESVLECGGGRGDIGKCVGEMWESVLVCGGDVGKSWERYEKVCGVGKGSCGGKCEECGKVLEEVWKGEMWGEV